MQLNNGLVDIVSTEKNVHLVNYYPTDIEKTKYKCSEKIIAVQHGDEVSFWIVNHFINNFYAFLTSAQGVSKNLFKTLINLTTLLGDYLPNAIGYLKEFPNGKKVVIANIASRH